jgi:hypothetical protein
LKLSFEFHGNSKHQKPSRPERKKNLPFRWYQIVLLIKKKYETRRLSAENSTTTASIFQPHLSWTIIYWSYEKSTVLFSQMFCQWKCRNLLHLQFWRSFFGSWHGCLRKDSTVEHSEVSYLLRMHDFLHCGLEYSLLEHKSH